MQPNVVSLLLRLDQPAYPMTILWSLLALGAGLFLHEAGADRFTVTIGALSRRLNASENVTGLLTAGAEWEELVVVIVAIAGGYPGLAVGNVIGSCLANLTGSMPLGLFGPRPLVPDRSARIYAVVMLLVTALAAIFLLDGRVTPVPGGSSSSSSSSTSLPCFS